ncbi:MAG: serine/threonine-protein kinase [Kofleriaceae bacterium]
MIGETLGSYTLERELGRGGMGAVYRATHTLLGRAAAVKVLLPALSHDEAAVQRFFNEAKAATAIRHPSIVEIYDFGWSSGGAAFIVMELLDGEPLAARLARAGRLPVATALVVARQIATALAAAHAAGIVHRDLKPDNIFLVPDPEVTTGERVKLLDFGIAKLMADGGSLARTTTGALMGTPYYMSPEQCEGSRAVDHRTDLYALGCILFQMVGGRLPFEGGGLGGILGAHQHVPAPLLRTVAADAPPALEAFVAQLLAKDPAARPPSADDVAQALGRLGAPGASARVEAAAAVLAVGTAATMPHGASTEAAPPAGGTLTAAPAANIAATSAPTSPRRRWPLAIAALLGAAGLAGGATLLASGRATSHAAPPDAMVPRDAAVALDATGDALYAQAAQALAERRWDTAVALARDLTAAGHPQAAAMTDQANRGKTVADAVDGMAAALAAGRYHEVRVEVDRVHAFTLVGDPDRERADELVAQARPLALAAAAADVAKLVKAGDCMRARTVAAEAAADWGTDATAAATRAAAGCKAKTVAHVGSTPAGPDPLQPATPPPATAFSGATLAALVRAGDWPRAQAMCAGQASLDGRYLGPCAQAACMTRNARAAAKLIASLPATRRKPAIDACTQQGVLLPLDLLTPPPRKR